MRLFIAVSAAFKSLAPVFFIAVARQMASHVCMRMFFSILTVLIFVVKASAADTNVPAALKIGALDATNYYDQTMIVTGKVVQVTIRPSVTFLNLDKPFPDSPFAVVIIHGHSSFFGDANALKGKSIEIRGKIKNYKDKPEIALDSTNQLTILNFMNSAIFTDVPPTPAPAHAPPAAPATNGLSEIL